MWLKVYIGAILMIVALTLLWYWRELQREKDRLHREKTDKIDKREPFLEMPPIEEPVEAAPINLPRSEAPRVPASAKPSEASNGVIVIEMRSHPDQPYMGYELLQALLAAGFRYGEMNVFNRYGEDGKRVLFSLGVASPTHSFELSTMGGFSCSGLIISMPLNGGHLLRVLDLMLNTADQLVEDLGGELLDEKQNLINTEIVEQWRKRIMVAEGK